MRPFALLCFAAVCASAAQMSVQVKSAFIKEKPSFVSKTVTSVNYGDKVESLEVSGDWHSVSKGGAMGWLHASSLSAKEIALSSSQAQRHGASKSEVVMAGKGFSKEVEDSYKKANSAIGYEGVDFVEKSVPPLERVSEFAKDGKLSMQ